MGWFVSTGFSSDLNWQAYHRSLITQAAQRRRRNSMFCLTDSARCKPRSWAYDEEVNVMVKIGKDKQFTILIAVPALTHNADKALGTYCEWQSATIHNISSD